MIEAASEPNYSQIRTMYEVRAFWLNVKSVIMLVFIFILLGGAAFVFFFYASDIGQSDISADFDRKTGALEAEAAKLKRESDKYWERVESNCELLKREVSASVISPKILQIESDAALEFWRKKWEKQNYDGKYSNDTKRPLPPNYQPPVFQPTYLNIVPYRIDIEYESCTGSRYLYKTITDKMASYDDFGWFIKIAYTYVIFPNFSRNPANVVSDAGQKFVLTQSKLLEIAERLIAKKNNGYDEIRDEEFNQESVRRDRLKLIWSELSKLKREREIRTIIVTQEKSTKINGTPSLSEAELKSKQFFAVLSVVSNNIVRFGASIVAIFLVSLLIPIYQYNKRLANFYLARADALLLYEKGQRFLGFVKLTEVLTPNIQFGKTPQTPFEQLVELAKLLRGSTNDGKGDR